MTGKFYVLQDHVVVPVTGVEQWAKAFESADRQLGLTIVGNVKVSTVFLGVDHRFGDSGPPIVFETMVFGGSLDGEQERYETYDQAKTGHELMVARVKI